MQTETGLREVASAILTGFDGYRSRYKAITSAASERFINADWQDVQDASQDRIRLYNKAKDDVCSQLSSMNLRLSDWASVKSDYVTLVKSKSDAAFAGTFFNSVFRKINARANLDDRYAFVSTDPMGELDSFDGLMVHCYRDTSLAVIVRQALLGSELADVLADIDGDVQRIVERLVMRIPLLRDRHPLVLELIRQIFYRNKGAYLVGRLSIDQHTIPVAMALKHGEEGVIVDAFLWGESRLSVLFSFTRSYFMVEAENPIQVIDYLQLLLPAKKPWELLASIGFFKHGKTEFVRGYRRHLAESRDKFVVAEGIRGQVMMVFGLASYQTVFKVIKDRFPMTKTVSHDDVRNAYQLVKVHDRVGRMADTQEFHAFEIPRERFDEDLLEELCTVAADSVAIDGNIVVISHLYAERMMTPLNLYIQRCGDFQLSQVLDDYGYAIKDLAAANIFPGDMLLKNFGVTRHGRVVFYDYDEICYLTDINFREMPDAGEGGMAAEPWFEVGEYDVFPEEFPTFLFPDEEMQMRFRTNHADLFTVGGWQSIQERVRAGLISDIYPYPLREQLR